MYPTADAGFTGIGMPIYSPAMQWMAVRRHFARLFAEAKKRGETQETIAARGGLRQNKISELLANKRLGPSTQTFTRAVEGLGLSVSEFFLQIERQTNQNPGADSLRSEGRTESDLSRGAGMDMVTAHGEQSGRPDPVHTTAVDIEKLKDEIYVEIGSAIASARSGSSAARLDRTLQKSRAKKPKGGKRRASHR